MTTDEARAATERICQFFETLSPQSLAQISAHYTPEARFKDPFNEVQGNAAIRRIFTAGGGEPATIGQTADGQLMLPAISTVTGEPRLRKVPVSHSRARTRLRKSGGSFMQVER